MYGAQYHFKCLLNPVKKMNIPDQQQNANIRNIDKNCSDVMTSLKHLTLKASSLRLLASSFQKSSSERTLQSHIVRG